MADASANKSLIVNNFAPGLILKHGTADTPNGLLVLENAWVDADNSITTRQGFTRINATPLTDGSNTNVHSHTLSGTTRYTGVGTVLKRGLDPGTNIIAGLSGNRISFAQASPSMATSEQWTYFANGDFGCIKKDNGTITRNWGINGPLAAPTVALSSNVPVGQLIDTGSLPYTVVDTGTQGVAPEPYEGTARLFTVTSGNTCRFRRTIATLDLSAFGEEGWIRLMVRVNRVDSVQLLGLAFDVGDGTFTKDFYEISTRQVGFTADNTWQELFIRKGDFQRVKSSAGSSFDWHTVQAIQFVVSGTGTTPSPFEFAWDDMRMEDDTHITGVVDYRVTWWNDDLKIRSNTRSLGDIYALNDLTSTTINLSHQGATVTRPAAPADPQVTHWEVWRRNHKGAGIFQYVDRIPIGTTTYLDTFTDEELGEPLVDDNHPPPAARFVLAFDECLFIFGMQEDEGFGTGEEQCPYSVRFSARFRPESFPFINYFLAGNPTDTITGGCVWQNTLWIFTKRHVYRVEKLANGYLAQPTEAPVGTESPYSISPSPFGIFYYAPFHGLHLFNGQTSASTPSLKILPFFEREVWSTDGITIPAIGASTVPQYLNIVGQYYNDTYTMAAFDTTGQCRVLVYNIEFQRWHMLSGPDLVLRRISSERGTEGSVVASDLEAGNASGWLLRLAPNANIVTDPGGVAVIARVQLTLNSILKPEDSEIDVKDFIIDCDTSGQSMLIENSFDDAALETLGTQSTNPRDRMIVRVPAATGRGRICYKTSLRLTLTQTTARAQIYGIGINYWLEPRRSSTFSGLWYAPKQKGWARRGRLVLRSYANVIMEIVFDETKSYSTILPSTNGFRLGVDPTVRTGLEGKVAYILFTSVEPFVIYESSYIEMGVFGSPAQMIPWTFARFESRQ
mgnify:CR=1 FL=1